MRPILVTRDTINGAGLADAITGIVWQVLFVPGIAGYGNARISQCLVNAGKFIARCHVGDGTVSMTTELKRLQVGEGMQPSSR